MTIKLRPEVLKFAQAMERKLRAKDKYRSKRVDGFDASYCLDRLGEEHRELKQAVGCDDPVEDQLSEAVDVANFAMMFWNTTAASAGLIKRVPR